MNKLTISGIEGSASGVTVEAQFNPQEIHHSGSGQSISDRPGDLDSRRPPRNDVCE